MYEPEQFPAAIVKNYRNRGGVFLIFANSKIICLGIHEIELLETQFDALVEELYEMGLVVEKIDFWTTKSGLLNITPFHFLWKILLDVPNINIFNFRKATWA